jgi:hypothetical protein
MMDLNRYFEGLKKKYGSAGPVSEIVEKFKARYLDYIGDDLPIHSRNHLLRGLKARVHVEYEISLIKSQREELMKRVDREIEGGKKAEAVDVKTILEDIIKNLDDFNYKINTLIHEKKKNKASD